MKSEQEKPLTTFEKLCAVTDISRFFKIDSDFCDFVEKSPLFLMRLRKHPEYTSLYKRFREEDEAKKETEIKDPGDFLNSQIVESLKTLIEIRDDPAIKAGDRLKATREILNRASEAPQETERGGNANPQVILQIPYSQVETIKKLAHEEGQDDIIELLEGEGYKNLGSEGQTNE